MPDSNLGQGKAVLVGMPQAEGHSSLPFALQEVNAVGTSCTSMQLQVAKPRSLWGEVLSALECSIFQPAGHGQTNNSDPLQSAMILTDGCLAVAEIFKLNLRSRGPFLAYLSACGTGRMRHDHLIDEGVHLIAACQLASFQHVIGALWEVADETCVEIAVKIYEWVKNHGMAYDSVSEALHQACRSSRSA
ncbi:unnamed protein product [Clonostachys rosea]|uniref:CHAT domain-containing protein n=1 Tax=Bionectria ochroleuca TaxID=29856 RepID=A0ABY6U8F0_BIOOC|nr:unnamed protein product [Clonostachys rosea]